MKTIALLICLSQLAFAGDINLTTQATIKPDRIGATLNPTPEQYRAAGWRITPELPAVQEGYERSPVTYSEGDGTNAVAVYADTLIADRLAAEEAARIAAETARQLAKPDALKHAENEYLIVCQQLTGKRQKLGFAELEAIINGLMATDPNTAVALTLKLLTLDAAGKREGGLKWWDDITDHAEVVP